MSKLLVCLVCGSVLCGSVFAEEVSRVLTEKEAETFSAIVVKRETKRQNALVLDRLVADKRAAFKIIAEALDKDYGLKSDASYTYTAAEKTLYVFSTNNVAKGKEPKKTVVKKFKNEDDSLPLRKLMAARIQLENQLTVLLALAEENREETLNWDAHLRKTFNLKSSARYEIKKRDDGTVELVELPPKE